LVQENCIFAQLLYASRDAVSMQRPHGREGLEDHQVQGPL
jgi:hypothetical protein